MNQEEQWLLQEKYQGIANSAFLADCERLAAGEPLGYIIGHVPFLDCTIYLDSRPLIPRFETEYWTEKFISQTRAASHNNPKILDLCAGSGCVGVAVAHALPTASVTFAELEVEHIKTITRNLSHNVPAYAKHPNRFPMYHTDLFSTIAGSFDHILANPPYIDPALDRTTTSVRSYEPAVALYGGTQGLELIKKIILTAPLFLQPGGTLWVEHEPEQVSAITKFVTNSAFTKSETHTDQYEIPRFTVCTMAL